MPIRKPIFTKNVLILFSATDTISCNNNNLHAGGFIVNINLIEQDNTLNENLKKLDRISALNDNWDGYGAEPLPKQLITSTGKLIRNLHIQPEIFPTADGTIQIEYEKENGDYLEFQFSGNGTCEVFKRYGDNEEYFNAQDSSDSINAIVEAFYG